MKATVHTDDGVELAVRATAHGRAPIKVVFVHGFLADSRFWDPLVLELQSHHLADELDLVVFDARGHGASTRPAKRSVTTVERMADDLAAVVDWVGQAPVLVVGHSVGTFVVQEYAYRHAMQFRARVGGLVLFNPASETPSYVAANQKLLKVTGALRRWRGGALDVMNRSGHRLLEHQFRTQIARAKPGREQFIPAGASIDAGVLADLVTIMLDYQLDRCAAQVISTVPVWVHTGGRDRVTPLGQAHRLIELLGGNARLRVDADSPHSLPYSDPASAAVTVRSAISSLRRRPAIYPTAARTG
ncbi:alpha/beta fold hydrolase [Nocardia sp. XZ_19_231]|uniref:alpha/beta fold hydrolase n=1 Tax=Nocardia sp. XZ_19_231 TaxID=2769252 RepID=UPI00188FA5F2